MDRAKKAEVVSERHDALDNKECIVAARNDGLTADQMFQLRVNMRKEGIDFKVSKNRLMLRALKGTRFEGLGPLLKGPIAIAASEDAVAAARVAAKFAKDNEKFVIVGGALGDQILDAAGVDALSKMPSLDELRAKLLGLFQAPTQQMVSVLAAPAGQMARVLNAKAEQG